MIRTSRAVWTVVFSLMLLMGAVGNAAASPDDVANRVANNVMSPFCPGLTLHDCPSDASLELRERIVGWAEEGWSYERIIAELETEYGEDTIRATPPARGLGLLAWALPAVALTAGAAIAFMRGRRWWTSAADDEDWGKGMSIHDEDGPTDTERARLEAELDELRDAR